mmetsp:Transcript_78389/g.204347  ORF Transcript_78389/g.204347 Transcript_78389/m.204347 type:complete len:265 (-) Transcript_78389:373-1167(-)
MTTNDAGLEPRPKSTSNEGDTSRLSEPLNFLSSTVHWTRTKPSTSLDRSACCCRLQGRRRAGGPCCCADVRGRALRAREAPSAASARPSWRFGPSAAPAAGSALEGGAASQIAGKGICRGACGSCSVWGWQKMSPWSARASQRGVGVPQNGGGGVSATWSSVGSSMASEPSSSVLASLLLSSGLWRSHPSTPFNSVLLRGLRRCGAEPSSSSMNVFFTRTAYVPWLLKRAIISSVLGRHVREGPSSASLETAARMWAPVVSSSL